MWHYSPQLFINDKTIITKIIQPIVPSFIGLLFLILYDFAFDGFLVLDVGFNRVVVLHPATFLVM